MTYSEFVSQPISVWRKILHKNDEVARLEGLCMRATVGFSERTQRTVANNQEKNLVSLAQARRELDELVLELTKAQGEVRSFLYEVLEPKEADVLEWKYVNGKSVREIADTLQIEEQSARNKISKCDKKARRKYNEYEML